MVAARDMTMMMMMMMMMMKFKNEVRGWGRFSRIIVELPSG